MFQQKISLCVFVVMLIFAHHVHAVIFASGGAKKINIWDDSKAQRLVKELVIPSGVGRVTVLGFNEEDDNELVSGHLDGSLIFWNVKTEKHKKTKPEYDLKEAWSLLVNPAGKNELIFGMQGEKVVIVKESGVETKQFEKKINVSGEIKALAVDPENSDSFFFVTGSFIRFWDRGTDESEEIAYRSTISFLFAFNSEKPAKEYVYSEEVFGKTGIFHSQKGRLIVFNKECPTSIMFNTENTSQLFVGLRDGSILILDIMEQKVIAKLSNAHKGTTWALACAPKQREAMEDEE